MLVLRDHDYGGLVGQYWILHNTSNDKQKHSQHVLLIWTVDEQQKHLTCAVNLNDWGTVRYIQMYTERH